MAEQNLKQYEAQAQSNTAMPLTVLFFGLGSIGARLARLVKSNFGYRVVAYRKTSKIQNRLDVEEVKDLKKALKFSPKVAFITNPTSLHTETAIFAASQGMHLFIEKPLCNHLKDVSSLSKLVHEHNLLTFVGCNLRFDPILIYLKENVDLSKIYYARVICSSYLPNWRPDHDYRDSYSAREHLGGGVLMDLIHEPDYCAWLFGPIIDMSGYAGKCSHLQIDSADIADLSLLHSSGTRTHVHLDYFGRKSCRQLNLFGENIQIEADLIGRTITVREQNTTNTLNFDNLERDYTYIEELKYFFHCLELNRQPFNGIDEHLKILKPVVKFQEDLKLRG